MRFARAIALVCALPAAARAHANFSDYENNRYVKLTLMPDRLRLAYMILHGRAPAEGVRRRMDANGDGVIDAGEGERFVRRLGEQVGAALRLRVDGRAVPVRFAEVNAGLDVPRVGPFAFAIDLVAELPLRPGRHEVLYDDEHELERLGETDVVLEEAPGVRLVAASQGGLRRALRSAFRFRGRADVTGENRRIALAFEPAPGAAPRGADDALTGFLRRSRLGPVGLAWAALAAFGLGALHALGPGHGKSAVAFYLVGARATALHAAALGGTLATAHVGSVLLAGAAALWAAERYLPERVAPLLEVGAGAAITLVGLTLLARRLSARRAPGGHAHEHGDAGGAPSLGAILGLGLAAGVVPCPAAIAVLLVAVAVGRVALGLGIILVFSAGLAATLTAVGLVAVKARGWLERFDAGGAIARRAPIVSAALVTLLGAALTVEALWSR